MKKIFTIILAFIVSAGTLFAQSSGNCGMNVHWQYAAGTLTIFGDGTMDDYTYSGTTIPWISYGYNIQHIIIEDGVKNIGNYTFTELPNLTSVTIGNSVEIIGEGALGGCPKLTSIEIPNSVTSIGVEAFENCSGLTSLTIPNSVTSIGDQAFWNCTGLTSLTIGNSVTSIGEYAFGSCTSLTSVTCKAVTPPACTSSFYHTSKFTLYVPAGSVEAYKEATEWKSAYKEVLPIGDEYLDSGTCGADGDNLTWKLSYEGVLTISGKGAMKDWSNYQSSWYASRSVIKSVVTENGVTSIGNYAFQDCNALSSLTIVNSITSIGNFVFDGCTGLTEINVAAGNPNYSSEDGVLFNKDKTSLIRYPISNAHTEYTIPNSVTNIESHAFEGCKYFTSITCKAVTPPACGEVCFKDVDKSIPVNVPSQSIDTYKKAEGWKNFENFKPLNEGTCGADGDNLTWNFSANTLTISGTGEMADYSDYASTPWYSLYYHWWDGINETFTGNFKHVVIEDGVTRIGDLAFASISESFTSITCKAVTPPACGNMCFVGVDKDVLVYVPVQSVEAYKTADVWKDYFKNILPLVEYPVVGTCGKEGDNLTWTLEEGGLLTISGTSEMADWKYNDPTPWNPYDLLIGKVVIEEGVTGIGKYAFYSCSAMLEVNVAAGNPNYSSEDGVLFNKDKTSLIKYPAGNTRTGYTIPDGVTTIGEYAFEGCKYLTSITCKEVTPPVCGDYCFKDMDKDIIVYVPFHSVSAYKKAKGWEDFKHFQSSDPQSGTCGKDGDNLIWIFSANTLTISGTGEMADYSDYASTPWYSLYYHWWDGINETFTGNFKHVVIEDGVTRIGDLAFASISESFTSITCKAVTPPACGNMCFVGVDKDVLVYVPVQSVEAYKSADVWKDFSNILPLVEYPVNGTYGDNLTWELTSDGVLTISGTGKMADWDDFSEVTWQIFRDYIQSVVIEEGITYICAAAFMNCKKMVTVSIPSTVTIIEVFAFDDCSSLTSVTIPSSVTTIGGRAFQGCTALTSITCKAVTPPACGEDCFLNVDKSIPVYVPVQSVEAYKSADVWKDFENIQVLPVHTCADVNTALDGTTVQIAFADVIFVSGRYAYIQDETGTTLLYLSHEDDNIQPGIRIMDLQGEVDIYRGLPEIRPSNQDDWTLAVPEEIIPKVVSLEDVPTAGMVNQLVFISKVFVEAGEFTTSSQSNLAIQMPNGGSAILRNQFRQEETFAENKVYDVMAAVAVYNTTVQLYFIQVLGAYDFYHVRFLSDDGATVLDDQIVPAGTVPVFGGEIPVKEDQGCYTYPFAGWDKTIYPASQDIDYKAVYEEEVKDYTVTFLSDDGETILGEFTVACGTDLSDPEIIAEIESYLDRTKKSTAQYNYTFAGWTPALDGVTGDATYTAVYEEELRYYTITWIDWDGSFIDEETYPYGDMPSHFGPTRGSTPQYDYTFSSWSPAIAPVSGDATYTAVYKETLCSYTVTWKTDDGSVIAQENYNYGDMPNHAAPVKESTAQFHYTFAGWSPDVVKVTGPAIYTAVFDAELRSYTVTWVNWDGTVLDKETYDYGSTPYYVYDDPTRPATAENTFTFTGWSPEISEVTGDVTYKAQFSATGQTYTITWKMDDGSVIAKETYAYGDMPNHAAPVKESTAQYNYTFTGWTPEISKVTGDATYTAVFKAEVRSYTVTWLNWDGAELAKETYAYGAQPEYKGNTPARKATAQFSYTFTGWNPAVAKVTGDATYTATFKETKNSYTITWKMDDGSVIAKETYAYGDMPSHAVPVKEATAQYSFTFTGWSPVIAPVSGDATYTASFKAEVRSYTVTWKNWDGKQLAKETYTYGETPAFTGAVPVHPATEQFSYTFTGWSPAIVSVTGDATYTAVFKETKNSYTVTWKMDDGTLIAQQSYNYGETPSHTAPVKPATAQYTYTFTGWTPAIVAVTGDATYTAVFKAEVRSYTVSWLNWDGTELAKESYTYGVTPSFKGSTPSRPATAQNTFTFTGWSPVIAPVSGDVTYKAQFSATGQTYTVTWKMDDGSVIAQETYAYGDMPNHAAPVKEATTQYTYTFEGWTPAVVTVTSDATYTAVFKAEVRNYTVSWLNWDGSELAKESYAYGTQPAYKGATPSRPATEQFSYTFTGWTPAVAKVTGDAAYTAVFKAEVRTYTVTWLNWDGTELGKESYAYGSKPEYKGNKPVKAATAQFSYTFTGWSPEVAEVTGDAAYTAVFKETTNTYTVTWKMDDGSELGKETYAYGEMPGHNNPYKPATAQFNYTFAGWSPSLVPVTGDATYTAVFKAEERSYTVTWVNWDGTTLVKESYPYGVTPAYNGAVPVRPATEQNTFTFTGWSPDIAAVTGDVTYKAQFTSAGQTYTVTWKMDDGSELGKETYAYGETPSRETPVKPATAQYTYTFEGWTPEIKAVSGDAAYTAVFKAVERSYTVIWVNWDGNELAKETYAYGAKPEYKGTTPARPATAENTFTFTGWSPAITAVTGDVTYKAQFSSTGQTYTVTWKMDDGSELGKETYVYGDMPSHAAPVKEETAQHTYTFTGWSPEVTEVTEDATYTAVFKAEERSYTVTWVNWDGAELVKETYLYGATPEYKGSTPVKPATEQNVYTFTGWSPAVGLVTGDVTYKAQFSSAGVTYTVTFLGKDGNVLDKQEVFVGGAAVAPEAPEVEGFTFTGWDKKFDVVTEDMTVKALYEEVIDLTPTNLAVVLNEKDGDVQLVFSWDKVDGVPSYEVKLIADGEELGAMNTFGQNKVTLLLSQVLAMYSIPAGTYTMDWEVRSTDIMGKAVSDWAQGPQFEITVKGEATGAEEVPSDKVQGTKVFINGQIFILRGDATYTVQGQKIN